MTETTSVSWWVDSSRGAEFVFRRAPTLAWLVFPIAYHMYTSCWKNVILTKTFPVPKKENKLRKYFDQNIFSERPYYIDQKLREVIILWLINCVFVEWWKLPKGFLTYLQMMLSLTSSDHLPETWSLMICFLLTLRNAASSRFLGKKFIQLRRKIKTGSLYSLFGTAANSNRGAESMHSTILMVINVCLSLRCLKAVNSFLWKARKSYIAPWELINKTC